MGLDNFNLYFNIFTLIAVVVAAVFVGRNRGAAAAEAKVQDAQEALVNVLKAELEAVRGRLDRVHNELDESLSANRTAQEQLSKLEALPDMTLLLQEMKAQREWAEKNTTDAMRSVTEMFENHERRAQERHALIVESFGQQVKSFGQLSEGLAEINKSLRVLNGGAR